MPKLKTINIESLKNSNLSTKSLGAQYRKLRTIAMKRISRIEKSEFGPTPLTEKYKYLLDPISKLNDSDLVYALMDVVDFLNSKTSTLGGLRADINNKIETFNSHGYEFINKDNIMDFLLYMDTWRDEQSSKIYASESAALLYEQAERLDIDTDTILNNFDKFRKNLTKLELYEPKKKEKFTDSDLFKKIMGD